MLIIDPSLEYAGEPLEWLVVFDHGTSKPWFDRLVPGRFKHVSVAAYLDVPKVWLFYDIGWTGTKIKVLSAKSGEIYLGRYLVSGRKILRVPYSRAPTSWWTKVLGIWCVPAVKHLIRSRSGALLPDSLWRDLRAAGAQIFP